ncbi:dihydropteroate synthase [Paenibacillus sp. FJAT-26967]|uniref:dihydropteroate synthase n=1 Tax=Paenibacillus sp. FJAT-26967 TaxID=1729690 RepID=UPI000838BD87|nr:dihydropteroate synthase [Paenibacillus sp. FJAT-26967]
MNRVFSMGKINLELGRRTQIMGILNVTPDSFSDGGAYLAQEQAVRHAVRMVEEGADLIDIGGESTRPGHEPVSLEEELQRVVPVIKELVKYIDVPISVDTYKAEVARQAIAAGAHIINDVWGFKADPDMARVAAEACCPVILMHNREEAVYNDFLPDVLQDLRDSVQLALDAGVASENIMLDPGIGFAKSHEQNLWLMNRLRDIADLGYPVLLGTSRKSMIRTTLGLPPEDVLEGTAATVVLGIAQGCDIVRVHDVREMKRTAVMTDAIVRGSDLRVQL